MERETLLGALVALLCGPAVLGGALLPTRRLWLPLVPAALAVAALAGWALDEPDPADEWLGVASLVVLVPVAIVWGRALVRAAAALVPRPLVDGSASTVGLLRPAVRISPGLAAALDPEELAAVRAHEAAHARHRDPLRIWLAQLVTDLQWPLPMGEWRFALWRADLELARDREARVGGVRGADLAAAILTSARMTRGAACGGAALAGHALRERVERLLAPLHPEPERARPRVARVTTLLAAAAGAGVLGNLFGEDLVRVLPGVLF